MSSKAIEQATRDKIDLAKEYGVWGTLASTGEKVAIIRYEEPFEHY